MRALRFAFLTTAALFIAPTVGLAGQPAHRPVHQPARHITHVDPGFTVPMDEARVITFPQPIATVFIGNPTIADITIIDSRHAYLLGKTFGVTNMIGLDIDHRPVMNKQVAVMNRSSGAVTLNRGADTYNYACTSVRCETSPRPGDPAAFVGTTEDAASKHIDNGLKAAAAIQATASAQ
jgi:hypothetical protein